MGKRSAAVSDQNTLNGHHGGPTTKKIKYNNGQSQQEQQESPTSTTIDKESPKPEFHLSRELVNGTILTDLTQKKWRIGNPIGKGSFGEIFLASDNISQPVTNENAKYVVKIEPHSNGPLFVEIHCLMNTAKATEENPLPPGMPAYIASGSHYFKNTRYRFLVLQRFDRDLHSIIKNRKVDQKSILILAVQILEVLEHLHDKGYCHSDIKAENLMISKCTYNKNQLKRLTSHNHQNHRHGDNDDDDNDHKNRKKNDDNDNDDDNEEIEEKQKQKRNRISKNIKSNRYTNQSDDDDDEEDDDDSKDDDYKPDIKKRNYVQYSGSNPVRSCRMNANKTKNTSLATSTIEKPKIESTYQEMVKSHYLRPTKKINYSQFFGDDTTSKSSGDDDSTLDEYITRHRHRLSKIQQQQQDEQQQQRNHNSSTTKISNSKTRHQKQHQSSSTSKKDKNHNKNNLITEDRIFLIDFGLASKFLDSNGQHHPFCLDQRRAHDGTLEFTSRDAHMGAHSRRSDLECLGYNLLLWSQGYLPWKEFAKQQQHEKVHWIKEYVMFNCKIMLNYIYGNMVPKYLINYMELVNKLTYHERPNYEKFKKIFYAEFERITSTTTQSSTSSSTLTVASLPSTRTTRKKMVLNVEELIRNSVKIEKNESTENNKSFCEMKNNLKMIYKNLGLLIPPSTLLNFNNHNGGNHSHGNHYGLNGHNGNLDLNSIIFNSCLHNNFIKNPLLLQNHKIHHYGMNGISPIIAGVNNGINGNCTPGSVGNQPRLSPKNLRSKSLDKFAARAMAADAALTPSSTKKKSTKKNSAKQQQQISSSSSSNKRNIINNSSNSCSTSDNKNPSTWTEILSKDPNQIAKERCDKEYEREENILEETPIRRYHGNPTYAILEIQNRIKFKDRLNDVSNLSMTTNNLNDSDLIDLQQLKGFTKPMIDILRKRKSSLMNTNIETPMSSSVATLTETPAASNVGHSKQYNTAALSSSTTTAAAINSKLQRLRTKAGLRTVITPTKRGLDYNHSLNQRRRNAAGLVPSGNKRDGGVNKKIPSSIVENLGNKFMTSATISSEEETSCSSMNSVSTKSKKSSSSVATASTSSSLQNNADGGVIDEDDEDDDGDNENENEDEFCDDVGDNDNNDSSRDIPATVAVNHDNSEATAQVFTTTKKSHHRSHKKKTKTKTKNVKGIEVSGAKKRKSSKPKKRKTKSKRKMSVSDDNDDDGDSFNDANHDSDDDNEDDDLSSDYEYYHVEKRNNNNNDGVIPVATFRKRLKRTRSG